MNLRQNRRSQSQIALDGVRGCSHAGDLCEKAAQKNKLGNLFVYFQLGYHFDPLPFGQGWCSGELDCVSSRIYCVCDSDCLVSRIEKGRKDCRSTRRFIFPILIGEIQDDGRIFASAKTPWRMRAVGGRLGEASLPYSTNPQATGSTASSRLGRATNPG